ncbi:AAA family ATPase [Nanoarchaeota archaeon]
MTKFIAVASTKGGCGKTTVALNLATTLVNMGRQVVLLEANFSNPSIAVHLGSPKLPKTLNDAMHRREHITKTAYLHGSGLKIIPSNLAVEEFKGLKPKDISSRLEDSISALHGTSDFVIIDTAPGLDAVTQTVLRSSANLLVVTEPEMPSVLGALRTIKTADELGCKINGVVVNKLRLDNSDMPKENIEAILENPVLCSIPDDSLARRALALKHPLVFTHANSTSASAFRNLAEKLLEF